MKGNIYNSTEDILFSTGVCNQGVCSSLDYSHQPNPRRACMDTGQWHQEMTLVNPMEELVCPSTTTTTTTTTTRPQVVERRARPQREQALNCPRCNSTNTKFCYYNNYSLTQPRYFCKTCRRYWTEGGSLRNVPVGGGSRKNKRSSSSSTSPASATTASTTTTITQNPKFHGGQDLNLAFPHHSLPEFGDFPNMESSSSCTTTAANSNSITTRNCSNLSTTAAMELLRTGISGVPFMQMPVPNARAAYPPGFGLQDFRHPTLNFPMEGIGGAVGGGGGGYGGLPGVQEGAGRLLFPFEDLKVSPSIAEFEQNRGQGGDPPGFWNGMIGGGGNW